MSACLLEAPQRHEDAAELAERGRQALADHAPDQAACLLRAAMANGDRRPGTRLNAALAELACARPAEAVAALQVLQAEWPRWDEPPLRLAEHWRTAGDAATSDAAYRQVLALNGDRVEALLALGAALLAQDRPAEARPLLERCCGLAPELHAAWHALGLARLLTGQSDLAAEALGQARALAPAVTLYAVHLADAAVAAGSAAETLAQMENAAASDPWNIASLVCQASLLVALGRREEALDALQAATLLAPDERIAAALYGDLLARGTQLKQAERALRRAIALDADNHDAELALSVVLMRQHRYTEAETLLRALLDIGVDPVGPLCNLATVLAALGRQDEAVAQARAAIAAAPNHPAGYRALCNALPYQAGITAAALLQAAQDCARVQIRVPAAPFATPDPSARLRVGLLCGTLRTHPVGWLTLAGFEQLDRRAFDLVCFSPNAPDDGLGRRFAACASDWVDVFGLDDAATAAKIRALNIDILVDLGGYGDFGRMSVCAQRAAPVQVKWVGMQNHSTGLPEMDWFISDRWETPPELAPFYSERLLLLPDGYVCYAPPEDAPPVAPSPAATRGAVSFGCFNNLAKITPEVIATWAEIMRAVPESRLVLKTHQFNDATVVAWLHAQFEALGVAPHRVVLRGSSPHRQLLAEYADVDLILDPFPYSGGLTTCEALWMGVPTLTWPGQIFASRHSASHMSNIGLPDWVVPDRRAYVAAAIARAGRLPELIALRAGLRERVRRSPLCDAPRFAEGLGAALRHAWQSRPGGI